MSWESKKITQAHLLEAEGAAAVVSPEHRLPDGIQPGETMLEEVRRNPVLRTLVLSMGVYIAGMGTFEGFKLNEYLDLQKKKGQVKQQMREIDPLNRVQQVREIYGDFIQLDFEKFSSLQKSLSQTEEQIEHFSWLGEVRKVDLPGKSADVAVEKAKLEPALEPIPSRRLDSQGIKIEEEKIDTTFLRDVIEKTFPKNWFTGEVSAISFSGKTQELPANYGIKSEAWADFNRNTKKVTFYELARRQRISANMECLAHEAGHANDWGTDNEASFDEKAGLLLDVTERLNSEDRYQSPYVESIKNDDPKREKYYKATEYWAEICEAYFRFPRDMNFNDFKLVSDWVKKNDPNFDVEKANDQRIAMINTYQYANRGNK